MYGWYSKSADEKFGHLIYKRASDKTLIKVTTITQEENRKNILWEDLEPVGEVSDLVESFLAKLPETKSLDPMKNCVILLQSSLERMGHQISNCTCESCKTVRFEVKGISTRNPYGVN